MEEENTQNQPNLETKILQVMSDLKLNDVIHKTGDFIEAGVDELADLVDIGVLKVIDGAKSIDEAAQKVKEEADAKIEAEEQKADDVNENTWGAKKDVIPDETTDANAGGATETKDTTTDGNAGGEGTTVATTIAPDAPVLIKYKVAADFTVSDENSAIVGDHKAGDEVELTAEDAAPFLEAGSLAVDPGETGDNL